MVDSVYYFMYIFALLLLIMYRYNSKLIVQNVGIDKLITCQQCILRGRIGVIEKI